MRKFIIYFLLAVSLLLVYSNCLHTLKELPKHNPTTQKQQTPENKDNSTLLNVLLVYSIIIYVWSIYCIVKGELVPKKNTSLNQLLYNTEEMDSSSLNPQTIGLTNYSGIIKQRENSGSNFDKIDFLDEKAKHEIFCFRISKIDLLGNGEGCKAFKIYYKQIFLDDTVELSEEVMVKLADKRFETNLINQKIVISISNQENVHYKFTDNRLYLSQREADLENIEEKIEKRNFSRDVTCFEFYSNSIQSGQSVSILGMLSNKEDLACSISAYKFAYVQDTLEILMIFPKKTSIKDLIPLIQKRLTSNWVLRIAALAFHYGCTFVVIVSCKLLDNVSIISEVKIPYLVYFSFLIALTTYLLFIGLAWIALRPVFFFILLGYEIVMVCITVILAQTYKDDLFGK